MGKLDPNLLLMLIAGAGGLYFYFKMGGREMLQGLTTGGGAAAAATKGDPEEDVAPAKEDTTSPEPEEPDAEEEWRDDNGTTIYVIHVDGWMWVNGRRMYPPTDPMWTRYYNMRKYNYRRRGCGSRYRNSRWCKDKERFCLGAWRNTPWCRGFKRGSGHSHSGPRIPVKPPRTPPRGGGRGGGGWDDDHDGGGGHGGGAGGGPPSCPLSIQKNGRTYRYTRDPMPDVMPTIFPPPYVKQGSCVYKLDNNQGGNDDGRDGWDGHRGASGSISIGGKDGINIGGNFGFYTYSRIGNV